MSTQKHTPVIGIIGGIGAGKSTVASIFAKLGCPIIDADAIAHNALTDSDIIKMITDEWGSDICNEQGEIMRAQLGKLVFNSPDQLENLTTIIHPYVFKESQKQIKEYQADPSIPVIILDMPLLLEVGWDQYCDRIIYVKCDHSQRKKHFQQKLGSQPADLDKREKNQISLDIKEARANNIVINNSDFETLVKQVTEIFSDIVN